MPCICARRPTRWPDWRHNDGRWWRQSCGVSRTGYVIIVACLVLTAMVLGPSTCFMRGEIRRQKEARRGGRAVVNIMEPESKDFNGSPECVRSWTGQYLSDCEERHVKRNVNNELLSDPLQWIDPLIGTANKGHVFAGATLPYGMAKAVADVAGDRFAGFASDGSDVTGFSHLHDSGTGGSVSLGNFPIWTQPSCPGDNVTNCAFVIGDRRSSYYKDSVEARPGYFRIKATKGNITTEMITSNKTALYRVRFDQVASNGSFSPVIAVQISDLHNTQTNGSVRLEIGQGRMTGGATFEPSFGVGAYKAYFCIDVKTASANASIRDGGIWLVQGGKVVFPSRGRDTRFDFGKDTTGGAWIQLNNTSPKEDLLVRVGLSFLNTQQACTNAEKEIPTFNFDQTRATAEQIWSQKLSPIKINPTGLNTDLLKSFWSAVYRTMLSPQDYTGENQLWASTEPYFDSFYCIWDSFRVTHPLLTVIDPAAQTLMIRSLIDTYRHEGYLPDCRMSFCKGFTQGGSNADTLLVDFWLKGIGNDGSVNWTTGYEAIVKDAEIEPENWSVEGRGNLESYERLGYIPVDDIDRHGGGPFTRSISRTVEYAYNDYSISLMAAKFGTPDEVSRYRNRSSNWANLFDPDARAIHPTTQLDTGFTAFLQPKTLAGNFTPADVFKCSPIDNPDACYLNSNGGPTYEGSPFLYTFYVPQNMALLINKTGGPDQFIKRLDYFHSQRIADLGNEVSFLPVYLYHYAGRPGKSTARVHDYIPRLFNASVNGIPGNDDSGAMGAFLVWSVMGLFPVAGQDVYLLSPPFVGAISIASPVTGKVAVIRVRDFDAGSGVKYPRSLTLNGKPYTKNWITHSFFLIGGVLEWVVGDVESDWGTGTDDIPPSMST